MEAKIPYAYQRTVMRFGKPKRIDYAYLPVTLQIADSLPIHTYAFLKEGDEGATNIIYAKTVLRRYNILLSLRGSKLIPTTPSDYDIIYPIKAWDEKTAQRALTFVDVTINGVGPTKMILDSGATMTSVLRTEAHKYGVFDKPRGKWKEAIVQVSKHGTKTRPYRARRAYHS